MARVCSMISTFRIWMRRARARRLAAVAAGVGDGLDRRTPGGQPHRQRRPVAGRSRLGELVAAQRFAGRPDGIEGIGLGAVTASGSLGPVQLHHLLLVGMQEPGQAGAIATGALDRPHPPTVLSVGEPQQLLVADRGGRHRHLLNDRAADCLDDRSSVGVLWVSTPMTSSTVSASMCIALTPWPEDDVDGSVRTGRTAGL
jgi:hypothetical protein